MDQPVNTNPTDLYQTLYRNHGATPEGVGYRTEESQNRRFFALMDGNQYSVSSILDVGCGYGALVGWLEERRRSWFVHIPYTGIDVVPEYIDIAKAVHGRERSDKTLISGRYFHEMDVRDLALEHDGIEGHGTQYDLVVCSGALTYHDMPEKLAMLDAMWTLTGKVMAFNMRAKDTYVGDLGMMLPRFKTSNWRVRHDYGMDDMTVVVKRDE